MSRIVSGLSLVAMLLIMLLPGSAVAQPLLPCHFYGDVTVNGEYVPDGTTVTASIDGVVDDWSTTTFTFEGKSVYAIDVPGDDPATPEREGGLEGDTVHFTVSYAGQGLPAAVAVWSQGASVLLNLAVTTYTLVVTSDGCCSINVEYDAVSDTVPAGQARDFILPYWTDVTLYADDSDICCDFVEWTVDGAPVPGNTVRVVMYENHTAVATCSAPPPPMVPTINQWGVFAMTALFAGLLVWMVRRRELAS